jgi:hypothetical protein
VGQDIQVSQLLSKRWNPTQRYWELVEFQKETTSGYVCCYKIFVTGAFVVREPCTKLLHFTFNNTYDSDSCYNFAKGDPYGSPLANGTLCLNGEGQYLQVTLFSSNLSAAAVNIHRLVDRKVFF